MQRLRHRSSARQAITAPLDLPHRLHVQLLSTVPRLQPKPAAPQGVIAQSALLLLSSALPARIVGLEFQQQQPVLLATLALLVRQLKPPARFLPIHTSLAMALAL